MEPMASERSKVLGDVVATFPASGVPSDGAATLLQERNIMVMEGYKLRGQVGLTQGLNVQLITWTVLIG